MTDIELGNIGEDRTEQEQTEREENTSFTEDTDNADADYDNTRTQISSRSRTNTGLDKEVDRITDSERQVQDSINRKATQRYYAVGALEEATDIKFSVTHGDSSKDNLLIIYQTRSITKRVNLLR